MKTHIFVIDLLDNGGVRRRRVTREIEIGDSSNLYEFAEAIVHAYGFEFDHAFGFFSRTGNDYLHSERKYELFADMEDIAADHPESLNVRHTRVSDVWKILGDTMTFLFDYGDEWRFTVQLVRFGVAESKRTYPRILKKTGRAPEQYPAADGE
jgi:Plasmid pRiA4b ORF-3-like protein